MNEKRKLSILIIDDEHLARKRLRDLLEDISEEMPNTVFAEASNGLQAIDIISTAGSGLINVALIDIRMPKMDGVELARHLMKLANPPHVIFVTAYDNYAVQAFELNAIDYLLKPVRAQRLTAALQKVANSLPLTSQEGNEELGRLPQSPRTHLSCNERGRLLLVPVAEILYLKADLKYVCARTLEREYLLDESLVKLEEEFQEQLIRLHRSVLVSKEAIVGFEKNLDGESDTQWRAIVRGIADKLPISRRQWSQVKSFAKII